jgi:hypothetical protein
MTFLNFSARGVAEHHKTIFGKIPCQELFTKKLRGKNFFL